MKSYLQEGPPEQFIMNLTTKKFDTQLIYRPISDSGKISRTKANENLINLEDLLTPQGILTDVYLKGLLNSKDIVVHGRIKEASPSLTI